MNDSVDKFMDVMQEQQAGNPEFIEKMVAAAQPGAVFGEPVTAEGQTVITANEVIAGGATGFGGGAGSGMGSAEEQTEEESEQKPSAGVGGGGGSAGGSIGRPVAAIVLNQDGVRVEPIVDVTKIGLAFLTTTAAILITLFKVRREVIKG